MTTTNEIGNRGEDLAATFLQNAGFRILDRNYRYDRNEVDLVCLDPEEGEEIVFVEVKTRSGGKFGPPEASVTEEKRAALVAVARGYLHENNIEDAPARFDVVSVWLTQDAPQIEHFKNAFLNA